MLGGGVSHPSQLTTGLVIKSVTTSPTLAGERMLFILQVSILSEQTDRFSILCFPKSEGRHHRQNGEWPKKRRGTTGLTVPMTRHGQEPEQSHNLQENSHARFFQLDKTTVRRNQPVQSRSGLRQAPRGRGKRRHAEAC